MHGPVNRLPLQSRWRVLLWVLISPEQTSSTLTSSLPHQLRGFHRVGELEITKQTRSLFVYLTGNPWDGLKPHHHHVQNGCWMKLAEMGLHLGEQQQPKCQEDAGSPESGACAVTRCHLCPCVSAWKISMAAEKLCLPAHSSTPGYASS